MTTLAPTATATAVPAATAALQARPGPAPAARASPRRGGALSIAALASIIIPAGALDGDAGPPGEAAGFGLADHHDTRDLAAAAARHPATRWCVTVVNPDGTAAAHGCAAAPPRPPGRDPLTIKLSRVIRGPCHHAGAQSRYRPGRTLQHLVKVRNATCTAPGCGRPAARCDLDHTDPWHQGGRTCPCNLAPPNKR